MKPLASRGADILWDLPPYIYYTPGYDIGCTIFIANHRDSDGEFSIKGYLALDSKLLREVELNVYGTTWFPVRSGEYIRLHGSVVFERTDVTFVIELIDRKTQFVADSVSTRLVMPTTGIMPPSWPTPITAPITTTIDWSSIVMMIMVIMIFQVMARGFDIKR